MSTDVIIHRPVEKLSPRALRITVAIWLIIALALVGLALATRRWSVILGQLPALLAFPVTNWLSSRRTYRADAEGIHARGIMNEPWSRIESVKKPTQWDVSTMVRMRESGEERSSGFPTSYAEQLAEVGGKPLV